MERLYRMLRRRAPLALAMLVLAALAVPAVAQARLLLEEHAPTHPFQSAEARAAAAALQEQERLARAARDARTLEDCEDLPERVRHDCYPHVLEAMVVAGPQRAFAEITAHSRASRWFARSCHMMMHPIGREHHGLVTPDIIDHAGKDCVAGFLHGYLEQHLLSAGALQAAYVNALCDANRQPLQRADCQHGIGHVLMRNLRNDLPTALRRCRALGDGTFLLNCAGGAFMENRFAGTGRDEADATAYYDADDPGLPCRHVPDDLVATCQAWAVRDVGADERMQYCAGLPRGQAERCATGVGVVASDGTDQPCGDTAACWFGYGYAETGRTRGDTAAVAERCLGARSLRGRKACAQGAGLRLGAADERGSRTAAIDACRDFAADLGTACERGFGERERPIDFN